MNPHPTLSQLPYAALEVALNQALKLDPATAMALEGLAGKRLGIALSGPAFTACIHLGYPLYISALANSAPHCSLSGSLEAFIRLLQHPSPSLAHTGVTQTGDAALLGQVFALFKQRDIDWEAPLVSLLGPVMGHGLAQILRKHLGPVPANAEKAAAFLGDYLMHERQFTPSAPELECFYQEIDALHAQCERLAARVALLCPKEPA